MTLAITAEIRGMGFRPPAKAIIEGLRPGASLVLVREPTNAYDLNAVQVWVRPQAVLPEDREELELKLAGYGQTLEDFDEAPEWFLGYIGKEWAVHVGPSLKENPNYEAKLSFSGGGKPQAEISIA